MELSEPKSDKCSVLVETMFFLNETILKFSSDFNSHNVARWRKLFFQYIVHSILILVSSNQKDQMW